MSQRCAGCLYCVPVYMGDGDQLMEACTYILHTGQKRPCPRGAGCTVYEPANPREREEGDKDDDPRG